MDAQTCCFTGHRMIPPEQYAKIQKRLEDEVVKLSHQGVMYYGAGGALGFDTMAALSIIKLKEYYAHIKLILVLPCKEQTHKWHPHDKTLYKTILNSADKFVYTSDHYYSGCMQKRNRHLVNHNGYCICYLTQNSGGTKYTVDYAMQEGLTIIQLHESV